MNYTHIFKTTVYRKRNDAEISFINLYNSSGLVIPKLMEIEFLPAAGKV
jgi:hypothetical protein